ncbi:hypothetical protein Kpol_457p3 [Vanderwaltozyma polyspora DSM 70294]|uniref:Stress-associated endoplasmic reticulum protein n=1 Tax=Vanderwaltozyma polyspora (strain ATCC 22028 / DSM 70294 / BCRC 21397 / CBS 2163 / NBRC 10782 / NRRL Y-8283 / UCD 57-17) TaxID=436907 RepID=A7TQU4_VANPO|nr:uncharacterized protein Kpol_457p3 [Vanderwaltozyma polyspora DSM 70294]EDO15352.1 hypothetical protein Kpol_457p3 [Vanderwaltozyma polyspora DSM 70294]
MANQLLKKRAANEKFAKRNEQHRKLGKKKSKLGSSQESTPISKIWIYILAFLIVGGGILELFSFFF